MIFKRKSKKKEIITTLDLGQIVYEKQAVPTPKYEGNKLQQLIEKIHHSRIKAKF